MFKYIQNEERTNTKGRENTLLTVGGMIGAGKTTITNLIADELGFEPLYENVDNNDILPVFYTSSEEESQKHRYPFLLQLEFLNSRYSTIKHGLQSENDIIMDRSIYEDWYFAKINTEIGNISPLEFKLYKKLLDNMLEELQSIPKKSPDLMIYLEISFETTLERIRSRGRDFEQDQELYDYYYKLWKGYDDWVHNHYDQSDVLIINMDEIDVESNPEHQTLVIEQIRKFYDSKNK